MMRHKLLSFALITALAVTLAGCETTVTETTETTETSTEAVAETEESYCVYCFDDLGKQTEGVKIQLCTDTTCTVKTTDEYGCAYFDLPKGEYTIHVLEVPEGFSSDNTEYKTTVEDELFVIYLYRLNDDGSEKDRNDILTYNGAKYISDEPVTLIDNIDSISVGEYEIKDSAFEQLKFTTTDRDGNTVDESIFKNAKLTVVNVFQFFCVPCAKEIPDLVAMADYYKDKDVQFIGIYGTDFDYATPDEIEKCIDEWVEKGQIDYTLIHEPTDCDFFENIISVPTTFFVDSEGNILDFSDAEWDNSIYLKMEENIEDLLETIEQNEYPELMENYKKYRDEYVTTEKWKENPKEALIALYKAYEYTFEPIVEPTLKGTYVGAIPQEILAAAINDRFAALEKAGR